MDKVFKLSEHGTNCSNRGSCWFDNLFCDELYPLRKPSNVVTNRYASSRSLHCNDYWIRCRDLDDGFYANLPYAQAPGMGLNAFFTFTVVFGMGYSWQEALGWSSFVE